MSSSKVSITPYCPADQDFLKEMQYEALFVPEGAKPFPWSILEAPNIRKYYADFGEEGDHAFLAEMDHQPIGAVWARSFTETNPGYGFVATDIPELSIALSKNFTGKGIGSKLMETMIDHLKANGYRAVSLSVDRNNPAMRIYERLGFEVFKEEGNPTMVRWL